MPLCLAALCPTHHRVLSILLMFLNFTIMCFISCTLVQRETFACRCWAVAVSLASSAFDSTGGGRPKCCSSDNILANMSMTPCIDGVWSICISYHQQVMKTQLSKYRIVVLWWLISKKMSLPLGQLFHILSCLSCYLVLLVLIGIGYSDFQHKSLHHLGKMPTHSQLMLVWMLSELN